jgi:glycosyltransferase involved in cell wall biosynthesis
VSRRRIALVVPGLEEGGGVPVVALFLDRVLTASGRYDPRLISVPMSSVDGSSVRLVRPSTWLHGPRVRSGSWSGRPFRHVGAVLTELEFQRYRSRPALTALLREHDLVQVVAGIPAWAGVALDADCPVGLQVATLMATERQSALRAAGGVRRLWSRAMTAVLTRLEATALRRVDRVFVENAWMLDRMRRMTPPERVVFAPPGVDTDRFTPPPRRDAADSILAVGRMSDPRKNVAVLFRAYRALVDELPEAPPLVLAGNRGPTPSQWELARELGIAERVRFHAEVSAAELVELYRRAAIYALSSDEEGLGLVILEAMACGCPVVSTDCGGPSTSVVEGETGFLVPVGDHAALARRMLRLLREPPLRRRMGQRARARAVESFSLEATGRPFVDWYDEVLG